MSVKSFNTMVKIVKTVPVTIFVNDGDIVDLEYKSELVSSAINNSFIMKVNKVLNEKGMIVNVSGVRTRKHIAIAKSLDSVSKV